MGAVPRYVLTLLKDTMYTGEMFELPPATITPVHKLRRTAIGIQHLQQTGRFKDYMRDYVSGKNQPFLAWDGEGWTDNDAEHRYMLLQNSYGERIAAPQISSDDALRFMLESAIKHPKHIHVVFGGGYDTTHILRDMPLAKRQELRVVGSVLYYSRNDNGFTNRYVIEYIPHKWLKITGKHPVTGKNVTFKIYDVMTFFQSSFMKALESRNIEVPEVIAVGKASRAFFTWNDLEEVSAYCQMELECLVMLCNTLRAEFQEAGIYVTQFHGPGAVASTILKANKIKDHMQRPPIEIERVLQRAYFGGRFEQFKAGHYDGKVYLYDINSAYPDKIRNLPSLRNSRWEYSTVYDGSPGVWFCSSDGDDVSDIVPYPLPWRGKGGVVGFPANHAGVWLWHHEARFATTVHYGYKLIINDHSKPFQFVNEMYVTRAKWKLEERGGERALKLGMNSLYGKMAQRQGNKDYNDGVPPWHQLEWAGMITSATRAQLWEAISQSPENIISVETDSVMSTVPLNLDIGDGLGQWGVKEYDWVTYVQSGIYFTNDGVKTKTKSRGVDVRQLHHDDILELMRGDRKELLVSTRQFIGLSNPATWNYGQWQDGVKEVKIAGAKRVHIPARCSACADGLPMDKHLHTLTANPLYGHTESIKHPLPWLDSTVETVSYDPELDTMKVETDAVESWESGRHSVFDSDMAEIPW